MAESGRSAIGVRIVAHPGDTTDCRLHALEGRVNALEQQHTELLDLLHRMTRVAADEHDKHLRSRHAIEDRVRAIELATP